MSDVAMAALQKRVEELTAENTSLKAENKDRRIKAKRHTEELEGLRKQLLDTTGERDAFKAKADQGPKELNDKIAGLEGAIRTRDHRDAFASVKEFEVKDQLGKATKYTLNDGVTIDAVWKQLDYKADGETPKAEVIAEQFGKASAAHPYLFKPVADPAPGGATQPGTVQARERGPGLGRGPQTATTTSPPPSTGNIAVTARIPGRL